MATRKRPPTTEPHVERPGPAEFRDPFVRREMAKAAVWFGMALAIVGVIVLAQPLLLIVGGAIFAVFLDGGARLFGRYLPIPRGWRLVLTLVVDLIGRYFVFHECLPVVGHLVELGFRRFQLILQVAQLAVLNPRGGFPIPLPL